LGQESIVTLVGAWAVVINIATAKVVVPLGMPGLGGVGSAAALRLGLAKRAD
jgi:hypothetical protein